MEKKEFKGVSIILNGTRYDAVEITQGASICVNCDLLEFCQKWQFPLGKLCDTYGDEYFVFKKSDKKFEK